jgi:hypothetical protein
MEVSGKLYAQENSFRYLSPRSGLEAVVKRNILAPDGNRNAVIQPAITYLCCNWVCGYTDSLVILLRYYTVS